MLYWVLFTLCSASIAIRYIIRWRQQHKFFSDDYVLFFAFIVLLASGVLYTITTPSSIRIRYSCLVQGEHGIDCSNLLQYLISHGSIYEKEELASKILYYTVIWTVKLSFLLFLGKFVNGLPGYKKWWFAALGLWALGLFGCYLSTYMACPSNGTFSVQGTY